MNKKNSFTLFLAVILIALFFMTLSFTQEKNTFIPNMPLPAEKEWGAYVAPKAGSFADFENLIRRQANMQAIFVGWNDSFSFLNYSNIATLNKTLVIFWEQYNVTLDSIIAGDSDYYIKRFATDAKAYGGQIILVPLHEMNGEWSPWSGTVGNNSPEKVILAYRHIHDLFSNTNNVKWGWAVNNESVPDTPQNQIANYYPGDAYVDYVGVDGFNFGNPWQSYDEIFSSALSRLKKYNKPIYIFSMACAQGSQKADWITDALSKIKSDPSITGFIWFNEDKEQNWLIDSDQQALQAFQNAIK